MSYRFRAPKRPQTVKRTPRSLTLLPSAREIFAVRLTHVEQRTSRHGISTEVTVTDPWPKDWTRDTVLARVIVKANL